MEKQTARKEIFNGKVIHIVEDDIITDKGIEAKREVVLHRGGACIALKDSDGKYFLVEQYRYCHETNLLEFCAGKLEEGEGPEFTVYREAEEELGYKIKNVKSFGYIIPTCGYSSEKIYLYYGEVLEKVDQHFDEDEDIKVHKLSFSEIKKKIKDEEITDAKTIALMYRIELEGLEK